MTVDPEVLAYYERRDEETRHQSGPSQLEAVRTKILIQKHAPPAPTTVLDIGGAAGAYAFWLTEQGYTVHLLDPAERLIEEARRRNDSASFPLASCDVGDARTLPFETGSADVVLLLGPLYHLTTPADRAAALSEAARVLKPGGILFAAAISRWASLLDGAARNLFGSPDHWPLVERTIQSGQNRNPDGRVGGFTTAYFHTPNELCTEVNNSGFGLLGIYAIEGFAGFLPDFEQRWADPRQRDDLLRVAELLQSEPALLGATPHLLAVGQRAA